ncbi:MAG: hypothetical protein LBM93_13435 [Oscillospiraceae bacterium]|jgi:23S rRNA G2445 N2-methylase RlmL|nr:hypothetical protein [Oscillospiraceae bacterium]
MNKIKISPLNHTWILDFDGTIVKHNGYKIDGKDSFLDSALDFLNSIPVDDMVIFLTSRTLEFKEITENFLAENNIRYNQIIYNAPYGERILINDRKPSGLEMAIAVNTQRDVFGVPVFEVDEEI